MTRPLPLAAAAMLVACAHASPPPAPVATETQTAPAPAPEKKPLVTAAQPTTTDDHQGQTDLQNALNALSAVDVFFGFNDATLTDQARSRLATVGDVLSKHPTLKVQIDGNCDERGTSEYNLALGQQRADSAKKYLVDLGAKPDQISTISYGAEKPRATGHDEKSWQENRRDDVVPASTTGQ